MDDVIYRFLRLIYIINGKLHGGLKIPLEDKIHIFAPQCNILCRSQIDQAATLSSLIL